MTDKDRADNDRDEKKGASQRRKASALKKHMSSPGLNIKSAIKKPGQLHRDLGIPQGQKIPAKTLADAAKRPGKVGERARFAQTLKKLNK